MVIYRVLGAITVMTSSIWFYFIIEGYEKKKTIQINAYLKLLSYIKAQIECYMLPIDMVLMKCDGSLIYDCGFYEDERPKSFNELLDNSKFYIDNEMLEKLCAFSRELGTSYAEDQLKLCERYISDLNIMYEKYKTQRTKDKKLSLAICLSTSLSLILILI